MAQGSSTLKIVGRNQGGLSYLVGDDTWKVAEIEVSEKPAIGHGKLEVIVDVKTRIPNNERYAVTKAIREYHQRTYEAGSCLTINFKN